MTFHNKPREASQPETQSQGETIAKPVIAPNWMSAPQDVTGTNSVPHIETTLGKDAIQPKRKSLFALRMEQSRSDAKRDADMLVHGNDCPQTQNKFGG